MSHSKVSFYTYKTKEKSIPFFSFIRERNFLSNFFQLPFKPEGRKKNVCKVLTFLNLLFSSNWCFTSTKSKSSWIHCVISAVYVSTVTRDSQNSKEERLQQYIYFFTRHSVKERQFHLLLQVMWSLFQATAKVAADYDLQVIVCYMTLQRLYFMYQYLSYHGDWVFHLNSFFLQTWLKVVSEILSTPLICCITSLIHVSFKSQQTKFESYIIKRL